MTRYRKKPIEVEAYKTDKEIIIHTLEGDMQANVGDYIITGVKGEQYPCKPEIFEATYEISSEDVVPKSEVEKIFEEFDKIMHCYRVDKLLAELGVHIVKHGEPTPEQLFAELKKKYTEGKNG